MGGDGRGVAHLAEREPGEDPEEPYADRETALPDWWETHIAEFQRYGLRPYRPPRLRDGTFLPPLIARLEWELDVDIRLVGFEPEVGSDWTVLIDDEPVMAVGRHRDPEGYSVFEVDTPSFVERVRSSDRS